MRRSYLAGLAILAGLTGLFGCGSAGGGDDFEAGNRLTVSSVTDTDDHATPVFTAVEKTDDLGRDHQADTTDEGEGNHFPDDFETVETLLSDDLGKVVLANQPRLGVDQGVDLQVYRIDLTYYDALGRRRDFAPSQVFNVTGTVPNEGTAELELVVVPVDMKTGLRWFFLYGTADQIEAVRTWKLVVDVYARDIPNDRSVHARGQMTVRFINPMVEQVID